MYIKSKTNRPDNVGKLSSLQTVEAPPPCRAPPPCFQPGQRVNKGQPVAAARHLQPIPVSYTAPMRAAPATSTLHPR